MGINAPAVLPARPAFPWWMVAETVGLVGRLGSHAVAGRLRRMVEQGAAVARPDNVPDALVVDFDFTNPPGADHDVTLAWQRLHAGPDIVWTPHHGGHWILTRAEDIEMAQRDQAHFSHGDVTLPIGTKPLRLLPLEIDPPQHTPYRMLIQPWFSPKVVKSLEAAARALTIELIQGFRARGACEFVHEFAQQLPISMFLKLVDLPMSDRARLLGYTEMAVRGSPITRIRGLLSMHSYLGRKSAERSMRPGEDLISRIVNGEIDGRRLTEREVHGLLSVVVFGGLDTVAAMLSFFARFLAEHPAHRAQLVAQPELIANAVDELIRRHGVTNTCRVVAKDFEYKGLRFKAGDAVQIPNSLFGLDERRFDKPLEVDFERKAPVQHAAFGNGVHRCAGALLARMELRIFLEEWLRRIPDFRMAPDDRAVTKSGLVNSVERLPLVWDR